MPARYIGFYCTSNFYDVTAVKSVIKKRLKKHLKKLATELDNRYK